jgi:hypothetical protein
MNYEKDIEIDETALDIEWLSQPVLFMKYSQHSAEMRRKLDETKQTLEVVKAEVDRSVREKPEKYDIAKVTEGSVNSAILVSYKYKIAYKEYLDAKYESDMAQAAVVAFDQRKTALENMVRLHGQQYFAGPKVPRDLPTLRAQRKAEEESTKKVNAGISSKLKRSK